MSASSSGATSGQQRKDTLVQAITGLTWMLPIATIVFVLYVAGALAGGVLYDLPLWLLLLPSVPSLLVTWIALIVALVDVTSRPTTQLSEGSRLAWLMALAFLNVLVFLPYWLAVARRPLRPTQP
ncbi:hypothetical protein HRbin26_01609 [bacterium HR26]|nr:hypothetical protein HRbin26_01609 [bacterium HR26]